MAGYTIEDIDIIRKKSGISYQEAIALLEYHNGNLAQALIDLERNGKIRKEEPEEKKKSKFSGILHTVYCMRLKIRKDDVTIINFSVLFCLVCAVFAPYLTIAGCVIALILGYRFAFIKHDSSFDQEDLESKFQHDVHSHRGAVGLMQLMPDTAAMVGVDPYNPLDNVIGGTSYLNTQLNNFGSWGEYGVTYAVAAYNAGGNAVRQYGGVPPYPETQNYVYKVANAYSNLVANSQW